VEFGSEKGISLALHTLLNGARMRIRYIVILIKKLSEIAVRVDDHELNVPSALKAVVEAERSAGDLLMNRSR
jgi:hypothetical protein